MCLGPEVKRLDAGMGQHMHPIAMESWERKHGQKIRQLKLLSPGPATTCSAALVSWQISRPFLLSTRARGTFIGL